MGSKNSELTAISIFSGGGGMDLGLEAVGFTTLLATDIDDHSCKTLEWGKQEARRRKKPILHKAKILQSDIVGIDTGDVLELTGKGVGEISLLAGGPPCQAFSVFGRRKGSEDPRAQLVWEYLRLLAAIQPRAFLFENVYGLLSIEGGRVFEELKERLANPQKGLHYRLSVHRLNAVDYAVPQSRDRIFIIGHDENHEVKQIEPITSDPNSQPPLFNEHDKPRWRTVEDALRGLPPAESEYPPNHTGRKHSERIKERYAGLAPGERDPKTRINKLDLKRPSFTIIVGSDKGGGKGHVHPTEPREVTPRESARIQTFPDWWAFSGTTRHPIRQVGNAVPPLLSAAIGNAIREQIFEQPKVDFARYLECLDQQHLFEGAENDQIS